MIVKKAIARKKLSIKSESLRALSQEEMIPVVGGASIGHGGGTCACGTWTATGYPDPP